MSDKYKILHLEDVATDAELAAKELKKNHISFEHHVIDREEEYIDALDNFSPDIILCDHSLPSFNSREALKIIKAKKLDIPFILITATMTEEVAMTVVKEGADDFILKDRLNRLPNAVLNSIRKYRLEKERKQLIEEADKKEALSKKLLSELTNKLLLATKAAGVGIWEYIIQTGKFICDDFIFLLYGMSSENFDGTYKSWKCFLHPEDKIRIDTQFKNSLEKGDQFDFAFRIICHNKVLRYIEASAIIERDKEGDAIRMVGTNRDVTERKLAEDRLIEYQEQLLESQRIAHIGSWQRDATNMADTKSIPWMCSEEALLIIGFPTDYKEMTFNKFFSIVHPDDADIVENATQQVYKSLSYYAIDHRIILPNGTVKWVHRDAKFIKDAVTGQPLKIIGTIQDITEQKLREFELKRISQEREALINELTNSLKDLKQFTYITSHNFKAPLSNLVGLLSLVDYNTLNEDTKEIVEMFKTSTTQLNKTINDLVEILIIRSNVNVNIANNNIRTLFDDVCSSLTYEINETGCIINKDFRVENIYFNTSYLESIVLNLMSNAIKYRSRDRKLKISASTEQKSNGDVLLIIKDNGIGIDLNRHRDKVFGLYQRFHSNVDGVGLGLFIVRSQLTALGGDINIESEVNKGSCFYLTFKQNKIPEAK